MSLGCFLCVVKVHVDLTDTVYSTIFRRTTVHDRSTMARVTEGQDPATDTSASVEDSLKSTAAAAPADAG